jgi:H+/Cl- antiporter ClcA
VGIFNKNISRSVLCGVAGIFLGILINPYPLGVQFIFIFIHPDGYFIILSIIFGGVGGLIGNYLNRFLKVKDMKLE